MITVEIRINGALIGHIYAVNERGASDGLCEYRYEYYEPDRGGLVTGKVKHERTKGAAELVKKLAANIVRREKCMKKEQE